MKVKDLIELLSKCDQEANISILSQDLEEDWIRYHRVDFYNYGETIDLVGTQGKLDNEDDEA